MTGTGPRRAGDGGPGDEHGDEREREMVRQVTARTIRRLDVLEWVILAAAAGLAMVAGALTALLLGEWAGTAFRPTWVVTSLLFFVVPGVAARWRERRSEREDQTGKGR